MLHQHRNQSVDLLLERIDWFLYEFTIGFKIVWSVRNTHKQTFCLRLYSQAKYNEKRTGPIFSPCNF